LVDIGSDTCIIESVPNVNQSMAMTSNNKAESIHVRLTETDKEALDELAATLDRPAAQIAREAVREKIAELQKAQAESAAA
jgi:hypothetical protein